MSTAIRDQFRIALSQQIAPVFRAEGPIEQKRQALEALGAQGQLPDGVTIERGRLAGMTAEWIVGPGGSTEHTLLHLHGGAYSLGSCGTHRGLAAWIAVAAKMQVVVPEYRLAPEHPFPAALDDAVAAYHALLERGREPGKIAIVGDSAGGGLALATLLALRDAKAPLPGAAAVISPWTDMTFSGESVTTRASIDPWLDPALLEPLSKLYVGETDRKDPRISPLFGDFTGLPPTLVQVGDQEILLSDSTRLTERFEAAGVPLQLEVAPELWHVWHLFAPVLPEANEALARMGDFLQSKLKR